MELEDNITCFICFIIWTVKSRRKVIPSEKLLMIDFLCYIATKNIIFSQETIDD